ncbi:hypothetical protein SDC9_201348 [bioreactor metagenome]|uniref:Uncharacterized protein n=1 Tax=bioreactor metagenome TaxID=1076179 RepID=A0A645J2M2_9ZZZZ
MQQQLLDQRKAVVDLDMVMKMDGGYMIIPEDGFQPFPGGSLICAQDQGVIIDFLYGDGFSCQRMHGRAYADHAGMV